MRRVLYILLGLAATAPAARADWVGLGPAAGYNEFVLGNATQTNTDVQGLVAVGGNLTLTNMAIATKVSPGDNLLVGGDLTQTNGGLNGTAQVLGKATLTNVTTAGATYHVGNFAGSSTNNGATIASGTTLSPTFFPNANAMLIDESAYLGSLANTGSAPTFQFGQSFFNAGSSTFALFHMTATQLRTSGQLNFTSNAANTTFVIDVDDDGTAYSIPNTGTMFNGTNPSNIAHVLYNFYNTTATPGNNTLTFASVNGSVLAPLAAVSGSSGGFNGQLVAGSLSGGVEFHLTQGGNPGGVPTPFVGTIPTRPRAVPEPGSMALIVIGGLGATWMIRRKRSV